MDELIVEFQVTHAFFVTLFLIPHRSLSSKTLPLVVADTSQNSAGSASAAAAVAAAVTGGSRRYKPAAAAFHNKSSSSVASSSSSAKNLLRHSNSALVGDIDSTFTPHKSGSAPALSADMPQIRIFLPKSNDDDDSSSSDSSSEGGDAAAAVNGEDRAVNVST